MTYTLPGSSDAIGPPLSQRPTFRGGAGSPTLSLILAGFSVSATGSSARVVETWVMTRKASVTMPRHGFMRTPVGDRGGSCGGGAAGVRMSTLATDCDSNG